MPASLQRQRVRFVAAEATGRDNQGRLLHSTAGDIATGGCFIKKLQRA